MSCFWCSCRLWWWFCPCWSLFCCPRWSTPTTQRWERYVTVKYSGSSLCSISELQWSCSDCFSNPILASFWSAYHNCDRCHWLWCINIREDVHSVPSLYLSINSCSFSASLLFTGNGAVNEHAEPQPRASWCLWAYDQALLWLQGLQQGSHQQQGHQAGCQEEVVL